MKSGLEVVQYASVPRYTELWDVYTKTREAF